MKKVFLFALVAIAMCACSESTMMNEPENPVLSRSNDQTTVSDDYTVTPEMVLKYVSLEREGKIISNFIPIVRSSDTLAYVVQYNQGWDLVVGDKRLPPVLIKSEAGLLKLKDNGEPYIKGLESAIKLIQDKRSSNDTIFDYTWKFISPKVVNENVIMSRSGEYGEGMWLPLDTILDNQGSNINHILTTKWGQDSLWKQYTPYIDGEHALVGCVAVATAQQIYHFRKNNNRNITIPTSVTYSDSINGIPYFLNFSTTGWSGFASTLSNSGTEKTAMFMSYIGQFEDLIYGTEQTSGGNSIILETMNQFKLKGSVSTTYSYERLINNLKKSIPVVVCAAYYNDYYPYPQQGHAFCIDGYTEQKYLDYVSYYWNPNYRITLEDLQYAEPWRFQEPTNSGKEDYKEYHNGSRIYVYIRMNWGYSGEYDDTSYLAYYYSADAENINESIYSPNWTILIPKENSTQVNEVIYNYVTYMIYDTAEMSE